MTSFEIPKAFITKSGSAMNPPCPGSSVEGKKGVSVSTRSGRAWALPDLFRTSSLARESKTEALLTTLSSVPGARPIV